MKVQSSGPIQQKAVQHQLRCAPSTSLPVQAGDSVSLSVPTAADLGRKTHCTLTADYGTALEVAGHTAPLLTSVLFLSDLDGTWLSANPANRKTLDQGVLDIKREALAQGVDLQFGYISARPLVRIEAEHLPAADWSVANNGGFIYSSSALRAETPVPDQDWEAHKQTFGFKADRAFEVVKEVLADPKFDNLDVSSVGKLVGNPASDGCPEIATLCIRNDSIHFGPAESPEQLNSATFNAPDQVDEFAQAITAELKAQGADLKQSPVYPCQGRPYVMFNLAAVDKGDAIAYLKETEGIAPDHVIIAGDGGNDIAMMLDPTGKDDGRRAIVVGNNSELRQAAKKVQRAILEDPNQDCALAVLDGLRQHVHQILDEIALR